jgi:hypothetical protein
VRPFEPRHGRILEVFAEQAAIALARTHARALLPTGRGTRRGEASSPAAVRPCSHLPRAGPLRSGAGSEGRSPRSPANPSRRTRMPARRTLELCAYQGAKPECGQALVRDLRRCLGLAGICATLAAGRGVCGWQTHAGECQPVALSGQLGD